jgi:hypothetical protein
MFTADMSVQPASTHTVYRRIGGVDGFREVYDKVSQFNVTVFPFATAKNLVFARVAMPACYILTDHARAYIGRAGYIDHRLSGHSADPAKQFAGELYLILCESKWFGKESAAYLQHRLTELAEQAGLVEVFKGANPQLPELSEYERAKLEHYVQIADRLLFDGGCRVLRSNFAIQRRSPFDPDAAIGADEDGRMQTNVITAPPLGTELALDYCGLWARGFPVPGGFVVMAGSEIRRAVNASANPIVTTRRRQLTDAGALLDIPSVQDRQRLQVAVRFNSAAIAAKFVTGAHVHGGVWVQPRYPQPILIAE